MKNNYSKTVFTPKNILLYLIVGGIAYMIMYFLFMKKDDSPIMYPQGETMMEEPSKAVGMVTAVVLEAQNNSGESGLAILTEENGKLKVVIQMENPPTDTPQPAHIHTGSCPTPGKVVYPLTNVVNGASETLLDVDLASLRQLSPLAVNVHKSASEAKVYVSCGNVE